MVPINRELTAKEKAELGLSMLVEMKHGVSQHSLHYTRLEKLQTILSALMFDLDKYAIKLGHMEREREERLSNPQPTYGVRPLR